MGNEQAIRAFLAIEPPGEVRQALDNIQNSLKRSCPFDIRWVKPAAVHLTLKFLGDITEKDVAALSPVAQECAAQTAPLQLAVRKLGVFPSPKRPRVLWIGLEGDIKPLLALQQNLEEGLENCGFARETRPFQPHLTMGRIKSSRTSGDPARFLARGNDCTAGSFCARSLVLFKSDLRPQGAVYTDLASFPFRGDRNHNFLP